MMNKTKPTKVLKTNWTKVLSILFFIILLGAYAYTFAVPPATKYNTGETLDPNCEPGDPNCSVEISSSPITVINSSNLFSTGLIDTGSNVISTNDSIFLGNYAGSDATNASNSNFIGSNAGAGSVNASGSNFLGLSAGQSTDASDSNFLGRYAGQYATNAVGSNFLGQNAGNSATNANSSNFFGVNAGYQSTNASYSNFIGNYAGNGATNAGLSNFIGYLSGYNATSASDSNFIGENSGSYATSASNSNFIGQNSGSYATSAFGSNFIGNVTGYSATNAYYSNFIGNYAGMEATNARNSIFIGGMSGAGDFGAPSNGAINAANSIFIGTAAGLKDAVNNTAGFDDITTFANTSILIGHQTRTGGYSNSIALGAYATNTATNQLMIGSVTRPINQTIWNTAGGTTCTLISTGLTCTSDENFKTNIEDLDNDTLSKLLNIKTITFNWKEGDTKTTNIGFLAQDLEDYFPELVSEDVYGNKSVNYANMTPILVESIRELDLKVENFMEGDSVTTNSLKTIVKNFLEDFTNGLEIVFFGEVHTKKLCIDDICIDKAQLEELIANGNVTTDDNTSGNNDETDITGSGTTGDDTTEGDDIGVDGTLAEKENREVAGEEIQSKGDENIQGQLTETEEVNLVTSENN